MNIFSSLSCCWFWLLLGGLIGWLLNRWLCKCQCKPSADQVTTSAPAAPASSTPAKLADVPAAKVNAPAPAAAPVASAAAAPKPASAPAPAISAPAAKAAPTPAPKAKPKAAPKAKPKAAPKAAPSVAAVIDLAAAKKAGFALKNANDLTVVEGIGPKINELFNNAGVKTFAQLAAQTVPQMRKVLDDGGSRFRIANPSTWAQQAALAAVNKWTELKKMQDELSGGVKK